MRCGDFKDTYLRDEAIFQSLFVKFWLALFLVFLLIFPFLVNEYVLYIANLIGIAIIGAHGLNLLTGFTGQISLGHAAFIGVGAYTSAILITRAGIPFWWTVPMAGIMSAFAGVIIGIPSLRIKGLYLAIATIAAQFIFEYVFMTWESMTRGIRGINVPDPELFGFQFDTERKFYFITLFFVIAGTLYARNLIRSRMGRAFIAIRDRDLAAELMGINLFRYKLTSFAISSFYAGVAGSLWVSFMNIVTPEHFPLTLSIEYLAMIIVGGLGSVLGSIYGAMFMVLVPELLKFGTEFIKDIPAFQHIFAPLREVVFGALIVFFLIFEPRGLAEMWRRIKNFFLLWPFSY
ncbi:MAG: branched-chain amino acid ABC transporter permease [Desulfobacteraceae bacterium]|nr:branched-chain amino acid ABC transporter permease [Desulfobacteraceae bacterium]